MGVKLLVVPLLGWLDELTSFKSSGVLFLDDVIMQGHAGVFFRRMRVWCAIHPAAKVQYDKKRHAYLSRVLPEMLSGVDNLLVVGTHPSDVDLLDFESVSAVRISDVGLRDLGRVVYGDRQMSQLEYMIVTRAVEDSVDEWHELNFVHQLPLLFLQSYSGYCRVILPVSMDLQRKALEAILAGEQQAAVWLEQPLVLSTSSRNTFLRADYDYLAAVRPEWRDAVVRMLGSAPGVVDVFRLPWFLMIPTAVERMCYRPNATGVLAVADRGESLIKFAREHLGSVMTPGELAGTWIGALLSDDVTAYAVSHVIGDQPLLPSSDKVFRQVRPDVPRVRVPVECSWAYAAVDNVSVEPWDGARTLSGAPVVDVVEAGWARTLPLVLAMSVCAESPVLRVDVCELVRRLHTLDDYTLVPVLLAAWNNVVAVGIGVGVVSDDLIGWLPGYTYTLALPQRYRVVVACELGSDPPGYRVAQVLSQGGEYDQPGVDPYNVMTDIGRRYLFSGLSPVGMERRVGAGDDYGPGFCYLVMFDLRYHQLVRLALGAYPKLGQVLDMRYIDKWVPDALSTVYVSVIQRKCDGALVLHFATIRRGVSRPLCEFLQATVGLPKHQSEVAIDFVVGDDNGVEVPVCYGQAVWTSMIVAWVIVAVLVLQALVWLWYKSCCGRRSQPVGRFGRV